tara:strand:- start:25 stop:201 length:177 start_codon:yes stop_codon:yes gene_type:complete
MIVLTGLTAQTSDNQAVYDAGVASVEYPEDQCTRRPFVLSSVWQYLLVWIGLILAAIG